MSDESDAKQIAILHNSDSDVFQPIEVRSSPMQNQKMKMNA